MSIERNKLSVDSQSLSANRRQRRLTSQQFQTSRQSLDGIAQEDLDMLETSWMLAVKREALNVFAEKVMHSWLDYAPGLLPLLPFGHECPVLDHDKLQSLPSFRFHARQVVYYFHAVIESASNVDRLATMLMRLGRKHAVRHFERSYASAFTRAVSDNVWRLVQNDGLFQSKRQQLNELWLRTGDAIASIMDDSREYEKQRRKDMFDKYGVRVNVAR